MGDLGAGGPAVRDVGLRGPGVEGPGVGTLPAATSWLEEEGGSRSSSSSKRRVCRGGPS